MENKNSQDRTEPISEEGLAEALNKPGQVPFIGSVVPMRIGFQKFMARLELEHFPPGTKTNDDFMVYMKALEGMIFSIVSIPEEFEEIALTIAGECDLRGVRDRAPVVIVDDSVQPVLPGVDSIWWMENVPGHPVYEASPEQYEELIESEIREINALYKLHGYNYRHEI